MPRALTNLFTMKVDAASKGYNINDMSGLLAASSISDQQQEEGPATALFIQQESTALDRADLKTLLCVYSGFKCMTCQGGCVCDIFVQRRGRWRHQQGNVWKIRWHPDRTHVGSTSFYFVRFTM